MEQNEKISQLIETAKNLIGTPYKYGVYLNPDSSPTEGFDCSSFIQYVFGKIGVELPRSSILQAAENGQRIENIGQAQIGDLVFFEGTRGHYRHDLFPGEKIYIGHLGIYLGNDEIIHATNNSIVSGVVIQKISELQKLYPEAYQIVMVKRFV